MKSLLQRILSVPLMYDLMQNFFGSKKKKEILRRNIEFKKGSRVVLDVGGGTGLYKDLWPAEYKYICLDYDPVKLSGFAQKYPNDFKLCSDATRMGLKNDSVDYIFCSSVSHHIHEDMLENIICDMHRILKQDGCLVFIDAVNIKTSKLNQFLWNLDRGEHPHTYEQLQNLIGKYFKIQNIEKFSYYYDYILLVAKK